MLVNCCDPAKHGSPALGSFETEATIHTSRRYIPDSLKLLYALLTDPSFESHAVQTLTTNSSAIGRDLHTTSDFPNLLARSFAVEGMSPDRSQMTPLPLAIDTDS